MKYETRLSGANVSAQISLTFPPKILVVMNNTPYSLLIRRGSPSLPSRENYDYLVPAGMYTTLAVVGQEFGMILDVIGSVSLSLQQPCSIIFLSADEPTPSFSVSSFRQPTVLPTVSGPFNQIIDVRGARSITFSISYVSPPQGAFPDKLNSGELVVEGSNDLDAWQRLVILNTPYGSNLTTHTLEISTAFLRVRWAPLDPSLPITLRYFLSDQPGTPSQRKVSYKRARSVLAPAVGIVRTIFSDTFRGKLDYFQVQLSTAPNDDYQLYVAVDSFALGQSAQSVYDVKLMSGQPNTIDRPLLLGRLVDYLVDYNVSVPDGWGVYRYLFNVDLEITDQLRVFIIPEIQPQEVSITLGVTAYV